MNMKDRQHHKEVKKNFKGFSERIFEQPKNEW